MIVLCAAADAAPSRSGDPRVRRRWSPTSTMEMHSRRVAGPPSGLLRLSPPVSPIPQGPHDLVREVFLRATRLDQGLCGVENHRAWLFQVARESADRPLPDGPGRDPLDDRRPSRTWRTTWRRWRRSPSACRGCSAAVPEDREAITLCDIEGLSQQALADRLGLSLPAAKSRVQRARRRLREQMVSACQVQFDELGRLLLNAAPGGG